MELIPDKGTRHFREYSLDDVVHLLKGANFSIIKTILVNFRILLACTRIRLGRILKKVSKSDQLRAHVIAVAKG